jgi:hypothetical protein
MYKLHIFNNFSLKALLYYWLFDLFPIKSFRFSSSPSTVPRLWVFVILSTWYFIPTTILLHVVVSLIIPGTKNFICPSYFLIAITHSFYSFFDKVKKHIKSIMSIAFISSSFTRVDWKASLYKYRMLSTYLPETENTHYIQHWRILYNDVVGKLSQSN